MKKALGQAIREGINDSELHGYKWSITKDGLSWSYGEEFTFALDEENNLLTVRAKQSGLHMVSLLVGSEWYHDCGTLEDAYRIATEYTIRKANELY